ncbi:MAG: hypothetical protein ABI832_18690 [bacterium]
MWLQVIFCLALGTPAVAGPLAGADDPAFRAAFDRTLRADDLGAEDALRDLAAAGNTAARVALPVVQTWWVDSGPMTDRTTRRKIDGKWIAELAHAAFKPADLWQDGEISPVMRDQLNRALWLYELGEDRKGDALLEAWFNHMPDAAPLPEGFADLPAAAMLKSMILLQHLTRGDHKALPVLQAWLDQDRIEGWMVFAELSDHYSGGPGQPMMTSLRVGANVAARLPDGRRAINLLWREIPPAPLPAAAGAMVQRDLLPRPQYNPVRAYCAAACPGSTPACETAFVSLLGAPHHSVTQLTPLQDVMGEAAFFATARGEQVLLAAAAKHRLGLELSHDVAGDLVKNPAFVATETVDACFANGVQRAVAPFPVAK